MCPQLALAGSSKYCESQSCGRFWRQVRVRACCARGTGRGPVTGASHGREWRRSAETPLRGFRFAARLLVWLGVVCCAARLAAAEARPDLTGKVVFDDGAAVTNATVFIYTAGPKEGSAVVCPSCYADCGKKAKTDAQGAFKIASLNPTLRFRLLVLAPGCESQ